MWCPTARWTGPLAGIRSPGPVNVSVRQRVKKAGDGMPKSLLPPDLFCPVCSVPLQAVEATDIKCVHCGLYLSVDDLAQALQCAHDLSTFGYLYPKVEGAGASDRKYSLLTDPILIWLALAAASGVVGNLVYDIIKVALRRLLDKRTKIPIVAQGQTTLSSREVTTESKVVLSVEFTESELVGFVAAIASCIAKWRSELAAGIFEPPSGKKGYVQAILRAQAMPGWQGPVLNADEIEHDYERFRVHYAERRKQDLSRMERCEATFLEIANRMRVYSRERHAADGNDQGPA